jgi:hypothetical protein
VNRRSGQVRKIDEHCGWFDDSSGGNLNAEDRGSQELSGGVRQNSRAAELEDVREWVREIYGAIRAGLITDFTTAQFNNQFALRALVRARAKQSAPLKKKIRMQQSTELFTQPGY